MEQLHMPSNVALTVTRFAVGFPHINVPIFVVGVADYQGGPQGRTKLATFHAFFAVTS
jgi:hypothetical protein